MYDEMDSDKILLSISRYIREQDINRLIVFRLSKICNTSSTSLCTTANFEMQQFLHIYGAFWVLSEVTVVVNMTNTVTETAEEGEACPGPESHRIIQTQLPLGC